MASVYRQRNGLVVIDFIAPDGARRYLRVGRLALDSAKSIATRVEQIVEARTLGEPFGRDLAAWVRGLEPRLRDKLAAVGLVATQERTTLIGFVDSYIRRGRREDGKPAKPNTITIWNRTRRYLCAFFGEDKQLQAITKGDAKDLVAFLRTEQLDAAGKVIRRALGDETIRRTCGHAFQFLQDAVDRELLERNPFKDSDRATSSGNGRRQHFITRETANRILEVLPDAQWRLLFALSRFAGLRCPSEHLRLRWRDIDLPAGRMIITSPKTEHHEGKENRIVPIFPELRPYLEEAHALALDGTEFTITRYRHSNANLRTALIRYIRRAGLEPWPKLFNNLRSTLQTELEEHFPSHVVCSWLGNSERIAREHYLQVTDAHFERAIQSGAQGSMAETEGNDGNGIEHKSRNPAGNRDSVE
jgi:integrase